MAIPFSEFPENPLNLKNLKKIPKNQNLEKVTKTNPNLKSLWAFLSSIFIYIYVFYAFNLSPSTLICTTKFWFLISNTLVLIVAVDFAAFSSAKRRSSDDEAHSEHVAKDTRATSSKEEEDPIINAVSAVCDHREKKRRRCVRSNSEEEAKAMVLLHRPLSERDDREDRGLLEDDKSNDFSRMSNEEVNRRVEEFIRRFNRQIRLQAVGNHQQNLEIDKIH